MAQISTIAKGAGAVAALAVASKAKKKFQVWQVCKKAEELAVGEPRIDMKQ